MNSLKLLLLSSFLLSLPLLSLSSHECTSLSSSATLYQQKTETLILKLIAIASILIAGGLGILIPILGRKISYLKPESDAFFVFRALAAGVILATGLVHILPSAFDNLTSPCLRGQKRWQNFPVAGFVAMGSAIGTMMVDSFATGYYKRSQIKKAQPVDVDDDDDDAGVWGVVEAGAGGPVHGGMGVAAGGGGGGPAGVGGHVHGGMGVAEEGSAAENIRHRVISQVLELGILVHSVIIGISLGTSSSSSTIRPLLGALSFHQFFEGIGLGGCIVQAKFRTRSTVIMAVFFSLTTPIGIALGIAVSSSYNDNSSTALVVEGIFNAAAAGILVYMALVNLLATDFMSLRLQSNLRLQLGAHLALLLGASSMSLLAIWA